MDSNGLPPKGHKGARDKAYAKWKEERNAARKTKRDTVNELSGDCTEDEDESDDDDEGLTFMFVENGTPWDRAQNASIDPQPCATINRFHGLADDDDDEENEVSTTFENFAHRVKIGPKQSQSQRRRARLPEEDIDSIVREFDNCHQHSTGERVVVRSEEDLQAPRVQRIIHALPQNSQAINRLASRCDIEEPLGPGECWVLADTGASVSALKVQRDCPEYLNYVRATAGSRKGLGASSACGGRLAERGAVKVNMEIDGEVHKIKYRDMDVSMPIASIKQAMKTGNNEMVINRNGGTITNLITGKVIKLHERLGVYFFKAKILPPSPGMWSDELPLELNEDLSGFARRG